MQNSESSTESVPSPRIQKARPFFDPLESHDADSSGAPAREGLPPTYRMRADRHYVDLLASRTTGGHERILSVHAIEAPPLSDPAAVTALVESIKHHGLLQPLLIQERDGVHRLIAGRRRLSAAIAAGLREVPCLVFDVDDAEAAKLAEAANIAARGTSGRTAGVDPALHAGTDLAQSLATLGACADLLTGSQSELSRVVVGNLIRAEVWRASCLLHATRIIRQEVPVARAATAVLGILNRVEQSLSPERQVRALTLETSSDIPHGTFVAGDERMLTAAVSGAVLATIAVLSSVRDARITMSAAAEPSGLVTFTVAQSIVSVPETWAARAFDGQWTDRPGGVPAMVAMLAVQRTADAHGGTATASAGARGTRISISIPTGL